MYILCLYKKLFKSSSWNFAKGFRKGYFENWNCVVGITHCKRVVWYIGIYLSMAILVFLLNIYHIKRHINGTSMDRNGRGSGSLLCRYRPANDRYRPCLGTFFYGGNIFIHTSPPRKILFVI